MSGIYSYNSPESQSAQNIGALTAPDPGSVNGQLVTLRGLVDGVEGTLGDATATPPANSISDRLLSLVSSLAIAASPSANSVQARLQAIADLASTISSAIGTVASPVANSLQARLQAIADSASAISSAVGTVASPVANSLQARIQSVLSSLGASGDAQATNDTGSFSAIALLKLIAARIKTQTDNQQTATATTTLRTIASSTTAANWGSAAGKGFRIAASSTNATRVLIQLGSAPTATVFTYELSAGQTLFEDCNYSGSIQALLPTGSTSCSANVTIFS